MIDEEKNKTALGLVLVYVGAINLIFWSLTYASRQQHLYRQQIQNQDINQTVEIFGFDLMVALLQTPGGKLALLIIFAVFVYVAYKPSVEARDSE